MAELHAVRLSAMFAADAELDIGASLLSFSDGHFHKLANTGLVNSGKRVFLDDFQFLVGAEEGTRIVAAHAERGLGKVVGAEAEELGGLRDFVRRKGAARNLDHGADQVVELGALLLHDFLRYAMDDFNLKVKLLLEADERNHDFGMDLDAGLLHFGGGFKD